MPIQTRVEMNVLSQLSLHILDGKTTCVTFPQGVRRRDLLQVITTAEVRNMPTTSHS